MPSDGDTFTEAEANQISNWTEVFGEEEVDWAITNNWHQGPEGGGAFEPRAKEWGYPEGFPLYAGVTVNGTKYHVYWIPNTEDIWLDPNAR